MTRSNRRANGIKYQPAYEDEGIFPLPSGGVSIETVCVYCGDIAQHDEHLLPYVFVERERMRSGEYRFTWLVPACPDCNRRVGALVFASPTEKRNFIREQLRASLYAMPGEWSDDEMESLGHHLRSHIARGELERQVLEERVKFSGRLPRSMWAEGRHQ